MIYSTAFCLRDEAVKGSIASDRKELDDFSRVCIPASKLCQSDFMVWQMFAVPGLGYARATAASSSSSSDSASSYLLLLFIALHETD